MKPRKRYALRVGDEYVSDPFHPELHPYPTQTWVRKKDAVRVAKRVFRKFGRVELVLITEAVVTTYTHHESEERNDG